MRLHILLAGGLIALAACSANPVRGPDSAEYLCFGFFEEPRWDALDPQSKLAAELRTVVAPDDLLAPSQVPPREVAIVSPRHRHAALCRLATLPNGKGCVAEKWYLYLDAYDRWFVSRHLAEACDVWEEIVVTS
jgi:hypothetical protein